MKNYYLAIALSAGLGAIAQPTITSVSLGTNGTAITAYDFDKQNLTFAKTGMQSWDFSSVSGTKSFTARIVDKATTPYAAQFPTANVAQQLESNGTPLAYFYGILNADSLAALGVRGVFDITYTNPSVSFRFPWTYEGSFTDINNDGSGDETDYYKYVAYGDIKTSAGTFNNVVLIYNYETDSKGSKTEYSWHSLATLAQLFTIDSLGVEGTIYGDPIATASHQEMLLNHYDVKVYPTPASAEATTINITLPIAQTTEITVMSADGKTNAVINNSNLSAGNHRFNLSNLHLSTGTYFVRIVSGEDRMVTRFTIQ